MNDKFSGSKRSRLEMEIDEILAKSDKPIPITARARSRGRNLKGRVQSLKTLGARLGWIDTTWGWFGVALLVFFIGGALTDSSGLAWQLVRYAGLAAFVMGVVRLFKPTYRSGKKMWRGRVIDIRRPGVELGDKFDDWRKRR